jgi:hypothetical protein
MRKFWNEYSALIMALGICAAIAGPILINGPPKIPPCTPGDCIKRNSGMANHECVEWCPFPNPIKVQNDRDREIIKAVIADLKEAGCTCPFREVK